MENKIRNIFSVLLAFVLIANIGCSQAFAVSVPNENLPQLYLVQNSRSNYTGLSCHFKSHMNTSTRYFDGDTILCVFTASSATSGTFTVTLVNSDTGYRSSTVTCNRNVTQSITWGDVGPGNYYLELTTNNDGNYVYITDLQIFNP